jgi:hypothetical protein
VTYGVGGNGIFGPTGTNGPTPGTYGSGGNAKAPSPVLPAVGYGVQGVVIIRYIV